MEIPILLSLLVIAVARTVPFDASLDSNWEMFKKIYGKYYEGREDGARRLLWEQSVAAVRAHNLQADLGLHSYKRSVNKYADLGQQELMRTLNGFRRSINVRVNGSTWIPPSHIQLPESVDWRKEGLVTDVKDQKQCGSCWAFSATGSLEGQHKRKTGQLVSLSEQNLIDCSRGVDGNNGCDGGLMDDAFEYVRKNNGIDKEESYPYAAQDGTCHFKQNEIGATCSGFVDIPAGDEHALQKAVATVGPISVAIDASHPGFHSYGSGIYDEPLCDSEQLDHGVLVVGYGSENGKDYWIVKNSWGTSWGLGGYIKMVRNKKNQCGIASMASYPLV